MREKREAAALRPPRVLVWGVPLVGGSIVPLSKEERLHARSRRLTDGDMVVVLDGRGGRARGTLAKESSAVVLLPPEATPGSPGSLESPDSPVGEPRLRVTVLLGAAEPARIEWAIEKGTECGAAAFVLLACDRSQKAHVVALKARLRRLRRIAEEATKQCDRSIVPGVEGPESTEEFLRKVHRADRMLIADPSGLVSWATGWPRLSRRTRALSERSEFAREGGGATATRLTIAIGPEGGFSPREIALFEEAGALRVSLGPRILRLETAVVAALSRLVDPV